MNPNSNDIGAYIKSVVGIKPTNSAASAPTNGAALDRLGFDSAVAHCLIGSAAGSPTGISATFKLQESDTTDNGDFADVTGAALAAMTANDASGRLRLNLSGRKRYIRVVCAVALTAGSSPTLPIAASVQLGGARNLPAT